MIENYIAELLETNNRVIVPDFGAFMVKLDAGKRGVTFNDFLKYNDGLLVNHVASKEKISKDDAFKKIREFAKELQTILKTSQKFQIASLGTLIKDERGGTRFIASDIATTSTEAPKQTEQTATVSQPVKEEADKTLVERPIKQEETIKPVEKTEDKTQQKSSSVPTTAQVKSTTPSSQITQTQPKPGVQAPPTQQAKPTVRPGTPPPPLGKGVTVTSKKPQSKSNTTVTLIVLAIIVVLGVVGGLFYLNYDEWTGKSEKERLAQEAIQKELIIKAEQEKEKEKEKETQRVQDSIRLAKESATKEVVLNQKKYYLVAGSFKVEKNAQRFADQLNSQGYNSEIFMESRGFWRVSYNSYIDRKEAFAEYQKLRNKDIQVWVIRH